MSRNTKQKNERKCPEPDRPAIAWWLFPSTCSFVVLLKRKKSRRSLPNTDAGSDIKHIQSGGIVNVKERVCVTNRKRKKEKGKGKGKRKMAVVSFMARERERERARRVPRRKREGYWYPSNYEREGGERSINRLGINKQTAMMV
jgi:hypothetical protein